MPTINKAVLILKYNSIYLLPQKYHRPFLTGGYKIFLFCFHNQEAIWQAYLSPASLGFPLSNHRRVDGYEIFHLR